MASNDHTVIEVAPRYQETVNVPALGTSSNVVAPTPSKSYLDSLRENKFLVFIAVLSILAICLVSYFAYKWSSAAPEKVIPAAGASQPTVPPGGLPPSATSPNIPPSKDELAEFMTKTPPPMAQNTTSHVANRKPLPPANIPPNQPSNDDEQQRELGNAGSRK